MDDILAVSKPILEFKRERLSLLKRDRPVTLIGQFDVSPLVDALNAVNLMRIGAPPTSGFIGMSEVWYGNSPVDALLMPLLEKLCLAASVHVRHKLRVLKAVIDTVDENTCLMPHSDDYVHHMCALRTHVPLIISPGSIGISYHPLTLNPIFWRMSRVGKFYAFNNFEPHTVTKLDAGIRAHLIVDMVVDEMDRSMMGRLMAAKRGDGTRTHCENLITHRESNFMLRNRLALLHGAPYRASPPEQITPENVRISREWIQRSAREALEGGRVLEF
jgi:hypothetical protein